MKIKKTIKLNTLIVIFTTIVFSILTISVLIASKNGIKNIFDRSTQTYFTHSASFAQSIFDEMVEDIASSTNSIDIPLHLFDHNSDNQDLLGIYLEKKIDKNLDFLIFASKDKNKDLYVEGIFLYDISALKKRIKKNNIQFNREELIIIQEKDINQVFIISSQKIINNENGKVLGTLIGGIELGFKSSFINHIKQQTNLDETHLIVNSKLLNYNHQIIKETNLKDIDIFFNKDMLITQYSSFLFHSKPSKLHLSMSKANTNILTVVDEFKKDLYILPFGFIVILILLAILIKIFLITPLTKLKAYAKELSEENTNASMPNLYILEYKDLTVYLKNIFEKLIKSKNKVEDNMKIIDKFVHISTTDAEGVITYTSNAFCQLSGYSNKELKGKTHRIMKNEKLDQKIYKELWDTITSGKVWKGEMSNIKKDGTPFWTSNTITPIFENKKIVSYTAVRKDISTQKMIEELAIKDMLTGLYNRRYLEDNLKKVKNNFERYKESFCISIIDIDNFKIVNDTYGHQAGDEVIKTISNIIKTSSRITDTCGRWGGEEFMLIMEKCPIENVKPTLEIIRKKIEAHQFENIGIKTVSIGVSLFDGDIQSTIKLSDDALYKAKNNGKNRVEIA